VSDLVRKDSVGWDKEYPKCNFCSKVLRFRTFTVQCYMTSQIIDSGKHKCETVVYIMEIKKDYSPLKARFLEVRKEIYNDYTKGSRLNSRQPVRYSNEVCPRFVFRSIQ
jgi:E3 ubiquitin-protein ligase DOA10